MSQEASLELASGMMIELAKGFTSGSIPEDQLYQKRDELLKLSKVCFWQNVAARIISWLSFLKLGAWSLGILRSSNFGLRAGLRG